MKTAPIPETPQCFYWKVVDGRRGGGGRGGGDGGGRGGSGGRGLTRRVEEREGESSQLCISKNDEIVETMIF